MDSQIRFRAYFEDPGAGGDAGHGLGDQGRRRHSEPVVGWREWDGAALVLDGRAGRLVPAAERAGFVEVTGEERRQPSLTPDVDWRPCRTDGSTSGTLHDDREAGLRLPLPSDWRIVPGGSEDAYELCSDADPGAWLTTVAYPPAARREKDDRSYPTEEDLWNEATAAFGTETEPAPDPPPALLDSGHPDGPDGPEDLEDLEDFEDFLGTLCDHLRVYVGRWPGLPEDGPEDAEAFLVGAGWLATHFLGSWEWFGAEAVHGRERVQRRVTVGGRPAAAFWHRSLDPGGETAAYLRLLMVQLHDGSISFALGSAQSEAGRRIVDACLDGVELIAA